MQQRRPSAAKYRKENIKKKKMVCEEWAPKTTRGKGALLLPENTSAGVSDVDCTPHTHNMLLVGPKLTELPWWLRW